MQGFSIIMPCEKNRFDLLANTLEKYKEFGIPRDTEFLIISRTLKPVSSGKAHIIKYSWKGKYFSPSLPINIGIRHASHNNIIITSPEVMPRTNVLAQLSELPRDNYICQVFDEDEKGDTSFSLVNDKFRRGDPSMYFLACFKREDLETINGWDEDFMGTYAFEDNDFGHRFNRAGLTFQVRDEIQAVHQYHPRGYEEQAVGMALARAIIDKNDREQVIRPRNGLIKEEY